MCEGVNRHTDILAAEVLISLTIDRMDRISSKLICVSGSLDVLLPWVCVGLLTIFIIFFYFLLRSASNFCDATCADDTRWA